jgi:zinc protease
LALVAATGIVSHAVDVRLKPDTTYSGTSNVAMADSPGIIALPEAGSPFIAFNVWVKSGSTADPKGKEGLASITASMLSGGGSKEDKLEMILEKMYPLAAGYGASVDKEMTNFTGRVHKDNLECSMRSRNALLIPRSPRRTQRIKARASTLERGAATRATRS